MRSKNLYSKVFFTGKKVKGSSLIRTLLLAGILFLSVPASAQLLITAFSGDASACAGGSASYTVTASPIIGGDPLTYQWQLSIDGGTTFADISGATNTTFTVSPALAGAPPTGDNGNFYQVVVTEAAAFYSESSYQDDSYTGNLTVNPVPSAISGAASVCIGVTTTLSDAPAGGTWSSSSTGVATIGITSGIVGGVSAGTTTIDYTVAGCAASVVVTVNPLPTSILGTLNVCVASTTNLTDAGGGTWASTSSHVTVNSTSGAVTGVSNGTAIITYTLPTGCITTAVVTVNPLPNPIGGTASVCPGASTTLTDGGSGTWSSASTGIATVVPAAGTVFGVSPGNSVITYTLSTTGCTNSVTVTVNSLPAAITGTLNVCVGSATTLSDGSGTWTSGTTSVATVGASTGVVTGAVAGTSVITFTPPTGCSTTAVVTVNALPGAIGGTKNVCIGLTTSLTDGTTGGAWLSGNTGVATIDASAGTVGGVTAGTAAITYTLGTGCAITTVVTVNPIPSAITGTPQVCAGATTPLGDPTPFGQWSSSSLSVATVGSGTGIVSGLIAGTTTITYSLSIGCTASQVVTVNPLATPILGTTTICGSASTTLSDAVGAGTWSSSTSAAMADLNTGVITGETPGTSTITFTPATGCGTATVIVTVNAGVGSVTGNASLCGTSSTTLADLSGGGTWSSSLTSVATIGSTGIVTGVLPGTTTITYNVPSTSGCSATVVVTVSQVPAISGSFTICGASSTTLLSTGATGGTWSSSNAVAATIGSTTGLVTGGNAGPAVTTITYATSGVGCSVTQTVTDNPTPVIVGGSFIVCGASTRILSLSAGITGGTWTSSNLSAASIGSTSGIVTGGGSVSPAVTNITYTTPGVGCTATQAVTDNVTPVISGATSFIVCTGSATTLTLSAGIGGGTWMSSNTAAVTVGSTSGLITGAGPGTSTITYNTPGAGCMATQVVTDNALPVISGSTSFIVCGNNTTTLTASITGGTWTSSNTTAASISSSTGLLTGGNAGPAVTTITYTNPGAGCTATQVATDNAFPVISGTFTVCGASTTTLTASITGGTWTSSTANLTINSTTGVVTGVIAGTSLITYTNPGAGCFATQTVTDNAAPVISGSTSFIVCTGSATTLTASITGGTWTSSTGNLTINSTTGVVTGVTPGTSLITYAAAGVGCNATQMVTDNATPVISGSPFIVCGAATTTLTASITGGTWTSSNLSAASIGSTTGLVTGGNAGLATSTITYTNPGAGCLATQVVTDNVTPVISGATSFIVCGASTTTLTLSAGLAGGTWSSSNAVAASIGSTTGLVTGGNAGPSVTTITYTNPGAGCSATQVVTDNATPVIVGGSFIVCGTSSRTLSLSAGIAGGTWSSDNTAAVSIGSTSGTITGGGAGPATANITYTTTGAGCTATQSVTDNAIPVISGSTSFIVCTGSATTLGLSAGIATGTWMSSNTAAVTVGSTTGVVTGAGPGTSTITYNTTGAGCMATQVVTDNALPVISGTTSFIICGANTTTLTASITGGTWSSSNLSAASIDPTAALLTGGNTPGATTIITYTNPGAGCTATQTVTDNATPVITGTTAFIICGQARFTTLNVSPGITGGAWSSSNNAVVSVTPGTGVITGGAVTGTATITYTTTGAGCTATQVVTDNPNPVISGPSLLCGTSSATLTLSAGVTGGLWTANNPNVTVGSTSGIITGAMSGTTVITYTSTGQGCITTQVVTDNATPVITSSTSSFIVCGANTATLTTGLAGGTWMSDNTAAASIGSTSGLLTGGGSAGPATANITFTIAGAPGCTAAVTVTDNVTPAITGTLIVCGTSTSALTLSAGIGGGTWTSGTPSTVTIDAGTGVVTGVASGTSIITYTTPGAGCTATVIVTDNPIPVISGTTSFIVCGGNTTTLTAVISGGTWTSSTSNLTINSTTGLVTGVIAGTSLITYTNPGVGCTATQGVTDNATPVIAGGSLIVCGTAVRPMPLSLSAGIAGGIWSSSNPAAVSIGAGTGVLTGVAAGTSVISYITTGAGCSAAVTETDNPTPVITGTFIVCGTSSTTLGLSAGVTGGTWSSTTGAVTIDPGTALLTGVSGGTSTISYTTPGAGCVAAQVVTDNPTPALSGTLTICSNTTTSLTVSAGITGGAWSSTDNTIATVGSTGVVTGVAGGSVTISYNTPGAGCFATALVSVNPAPAAITGTFSICAGASATHLLDATTGGTWSSSNTAVATLTTPAIGLVTGAAVTVISTATISYTLPTTCAATVIFTVNPSPAAVLPSSGVHVCIGLTTTLTDATTGGTWSSINTANATVGSTGIVTGVAAGTTIISYSLAGGCGKGSPVTVNALPAAIGGTLSVCQGSTTSLTEGVGGTWMSGSTSFATIDEFSGLVSGLLPGTSVITFTATTGGCTTTSVVTVNPLPAAIGVPGAVCVNSTITLTDANSGGTWSSADPTTATVVAGSGVVTGVGAGSIIVTYTLPTTCAATATVSVNPLPDAITGTASVCVGLSTTLADDDGGGSWTSSNTVVATTIGSSAIFGASAGTSLITYMLPTGCTTSIVVTVNPLPAAISVPSAVCVGSAITVTDAVTGGTWASGNLTTASIDPTLGTVTGGAPGTVIITYTLPTGCSITGTVTVNPLPAAIGGTTGGVCIGLTTPLSDATTGGTWLSGTPSVATIDASGTAGGVTAGTSIITYTLPTTCAVTAPLVVNPLPVAIGGTLTVCAGSNTTLNDATGSGIWTSSNASVATVGSGTGTVFGLAPGTTTVTYTLITGCLTTTTVTVNPGVAAITGTATVCPGLTTALSDGITGGSWSSADGTIATVGSASGTVTGTGPGTVLITYTLASTGCGSTTYPITVNPLPAAIGGTLFVCSGSTTTLTDATSGGTYSSSNTAIVNPLTGMGTVLGVAHTSGVVTITYTLPTGCIATTPFTVNPEPANIAPSSAVSVCIGSTTTLTDDSTGGAWSSSSNALATVDPVAGIVTGVSAGTPNITYTLPAGCHIQKSVVVNALPAAITGTFTVCPGLTTSLTGDVSGGTWASGSTGIATIGSATGLVSGVSPGTSVITFTSSVGAHCTTTSVVTVNPLPAAIFVPSAVCVNSTITLTDASGGGAWSSADGTVATIDPVSGIATGVGASTTTITYTLPTSCLITATISVNPLPAAITGTASVCAGLTTILNDATTGGTWSSSNTSVATTSGLHFIHGVIAGTSTITYTLPTGCTTSIVVTVNPLPAAIGVPGAVCVGSAITLTDASGGGAWTSGNLSLATIDPSAGTLTGAGPGTVVITYTLPTSCSITAPVTVNPLPAAIGGPLSVCIGLTTTLTDATTGGTWLSGTPSVATIDASGTAGGVTAGTSIITYTLPTTCAVTAPLVVNPLPVAIGGTLSVCAGSNTSLSDGTGSGIWSSDNLAIATVGSGTGSVGGVAAGTADITYTLGTGCFASAVVTVNPGVAAITGTATVCLGLTTSLSDAITGGTWSSSDGTVASADPASGVVSGIAPGAAVITYTLASTGCGFTTYPITVNPLPAAITGTLITCGTSTTTLSDASSGGTWSSLGGNVSVNPSTGDVTGISNGTAVITYTLPTTCLITNIVTVNAVPAIASVSTLPTVLCVGSVISLSATGVTGPGTATYSWTGPNDFSSASMAPVFTATTTAAGGTYSLTVTYPGIGCSVSNIAGTVCATVDENSTATLTAPAGILFTSIDFASYGTPTGSCGSFAVSGCNSPNSVPVVSAQLLGHNSGSILATNTIFGGDPCGGTGKHLSIQASYSTPATAAVTVNALPTITSVSASPNPLCVGTDINLSTGGVSGTGDVTYSWQGPDGYVSADPLPTVTTATTAASGIYSLTVTYPGVGCVSAVSVSPAVTVNVVPVISGTFTVCGTTSTTLGLSAGTTGGTWTSSSPFATIDISTGVLTGVNPGTSTITYTGPGTGCTATQVVTINAIPAITSATSFIVCGANSTTLGISPGISTGTWTSSNTADLIIDPSSGILTGVLPGTSTITYTTPGAGCNATQIVTDNATPVIVGGSFIVCGINSRTLSLSAGITGGTWVSGNPADLTIDPSAGVLTGVLPGTSTITYTTPGAGCTATQVVTDNSTPVITGTTSFIVCGTSTTTLNITPGITGGTWTSGTPSFVTVNSTTGAVTGVAPGSSTITYVTPGTGCNASQVVFDNPVPVIIGGSFIVCSTNSRTLSLSAGTTGGTWVSGTPADLTIDPSAGVLTGVLPGTSTITYTTPGAGCTATQVVTDNSTPVITGTTSFIVCGTSTTTLNITPGITGGTWTSGTPSFVTVNSTTGEVTGVAPGSSTITYVTPGTGCNASQVVFDNPVPVITGSPFIVCGVNTTTLNVSPGITGGTWVSGTPGNLTIGSSSGIVTGVTPGSTSAITYTTPGAGCSATQVVTDNATPVITGTTSFIVCGTSTTTLNITPGITGGTWTSGTPSFVTVNSTTGAVTGVAPGSGTITYVTPGSGCNASQVVFDNPIPVITGSPFIVCGINTTTLTVSPGITGGTWISSNTADLTIGSTTGLLAGVLPGTSTITYTTPGAGCSATQVVTDNATPVIVGGSFIVCGTNSRTLSLSAGITGGTWASSNPADLTIDPATGILTGVLPGTSTITYVTPGAGCNATQVVTDNSTPVITSATSFIVCGTSTTTLNITPGITGGTWVSGTPSFVTVNSTTGAVTGVAPGSSTITYTTPGTGCNASQVVFDNPTPVITGTFTLCTGSGATLLVSPGITGGNWTSSNTAAVTVGLTTGMVTGAGPGTSTITYTTPGAGCSATQVVTDNPGPTVTASTFIVCGTSTTALSISSGTTGGTWASSNTAAVTVDPATGLVTGVSPGTSLITYTTPGAGCTATTVVTDNPVPVINSSTSFIVCGMSATTLTIAPGITGGTWISTNTAAATIDPITGLLVGVAPGTSAIVYSTPGSGCFSTQTVTDNPTPVITGTTSFIVCGLSTTTLNVSPGITTGTWNSGAPAVTVGSGTGIITGVSSGISVITYTTPGAGCFATQAVTDNATPAIGGTFIVCGTSATPLGLSAGITGGGWSSSNTAAATVGLATGILNGVAQGTSTITYNTPGAGCFTTQVVTDNATPAIGGTFTVCGTSATPLGLTAGITGGGWSSSNTAVATVGLATGILNGVAPGTSTITYNTPGAGCFTTQVVTDNATPAISGTFTVCGTSATPLGLTAGITGGGWSSSNTAAATVGLATGILNGVAPGTSTITYNTPGAGCFTTQVVTDNATPAISGTFIVCGTSATPLGLTAGITGGGWSSSNTAAATVGLATGILNGVAPGTSTITYNTPGAGCFTTQVVTDNATPAISGTFIVCGTSATPLGLTAGITGGGWSSSNTAAATVGLATGILNGVAPGTSTITYNTPGAGCFTTQVVMDNATPAISGSFIVCGTSATPLGLTAGITGGGWSSSNTAAATVGLATGILNGVAPGTSTITYNTPGAGCFTTQVVTDNATPAIGGTFTVCGTSATPLGLTAGITGGGWSSSNTAVATVGLATGILNGVAPGTSTITYNTPGAGCFTTQVVTDNATPVISGTFIVCGTSATPLGLSAGITGGSWSSSNTAAATVGLATGILNGVAPGTATITYITPGIGCMATQVVTVSSLSVSPSNTSPACVATSVSLASGETGTAAGVTYSWNGPLSFTSPVSGPLLSSSVTLGMAGTYSVTATAPGAGCIASGTTIVTVNPLPVITATATPTTICQGNSLGLTSSPSGGSGVYSSFTWNGPGSFVSTGQNTFNTAITLAQAGIYSVTVTDSKGCVSATPGTTASVTVNPIPKAITGLTQVCLGSTLPLVDSTAFGSWSSSNTAVATVGSGTGVVSSVGLGTTTISYSLLGTGCLVSSIVTVNPLPAAFTVTGTGGYCAGGTGLPVGLSNSTTGVNYQLFKDGISTGAPVGGTTGLPVSFGLQTAGGTYTVVATNTTTLCTSNMTGSAVIVVNPLPSAITGTLNVCAGLTTSLADASTGGIWTSTNTAIATIGTTGIVSGITSGTSAITYTLPTSCFAAAVVTVNPLPGAIFGGSSVCAGSAIALGNPAPFGTWTSSNTVVATIGSGSGIVNGVNPGTTLITYTLNTGCTATTGLTVNPVPTPVTVTGGGIFCGSTTINAGGGIGGTIYFQGTTPSGLSTTTPETAQLITTTGEYYFRAQSALGCWSADGTTLVTINTPATANAGSSQTVCTGGSVTLAGSISGSATSSLWSAISGTFSDATSLTATYTPGISTGAVTVTLTTNDPDGPGPCPAVNSTVTIFVNPKPSAAPTSSSPICAGGTVTLNANATGGIGAITYLWSGSNLATSPTLATVNATPTATSVYSLTVSTSGSGCSSTVPVYTSTVTVNTLTLSASSSSPVCPGGILTLSSGELGTAPAVVYSWSGPNSFSSTASNPLVSNSATGLMAGTYSVTATSAGSGCTASGTTTVTVNTLTVSVSNSGVACPGGSLSLSSGEGGSATGVTYSWSGPNSFSSTASNPLVSNSVTGLMAGTYSVTATASGSGCTASGTTTVTVNTLTLSVSNSGVACPGGSLSLSSGEAGSAPGVTYLWSGPNSFSSTASNPLVSNSVTGLMAGTYSVTATAAGSGCTASGTTTVTVNTLTVSVSNSGVACPGGMLSLSSGEGGSATGVTYSWSGPNSFGSTASSPLVSNSVTGLMAGTYSVTATAPGSGCTASGTTTVTVNTLTVSVSNSGVACPGGSLSLSSGEGGSAPGVTYAWSGPNSFSSTASNPLVSNSVTGLMAGTYSVTATAPGSGCTASGTTTVTVNTLTVSVSNSGVACPGGSVSLSSGEGGSAPGVTFAWSGPNSFSSTASNPLVSNSVTGLMAGTYSVTATAAGSGCTASGTTTVTVNTLTVSVSNSGVACPGGSVSLSSGEGGSATGVTFAWSGPNSFSATASNPLVSSSVTGLMAGTYSVTATAPGSGCTASGTTTVTVNPAVAAITGAFTTCGSSAVTLADATSGGTWSSGTTSVATIGSLNGMVTALSSGTTAITYTTAGSGCTATQTFTVNSIAAITGTFTICTNTTLSNAVTGGTWSSGSTGVATINPATGVVTAVAPGTTAISYTLPTGCTSTQTVTVNAVPSGIRSSTLSFGLCFGSSITLADLGTGTYSSGNTSVATIGASSGVVTTVAPGTSVITYTLPGAGCSATATVTVNPGPSAIGGSTSVCIAATTTLTDAVTGGRWNSSNTSVATTGSTGIITGVATGTTTIAYTLTTGCSVSQIVTVNPNPSSPRTNTPVCAGNTLTLFEVGGGTWISSNTSIATVGLTTGVVGGVSAGNPVITYTLPTGCFFPLTMTINALPAAITGPSIVGVGSTITLADAVAGGTWSSGATGIATVNTATGVVRGVSAGGVNITYTTACGSVFKTINVGAGRDDDPATGVTTTDPSVSNIQVMPNPNKGIFTIKGSLGITEDQEVTIEVTDMLGQVVYTNKVVALGGVINQTVQLNGSVANGMYILSVNTGKENNVFHIVIEQ